VNFTRNAWKFHALRQRKTASSDFHWHFKEKNRLASALLNTFELVLTARMT
jgi:ribosome-associated toxin RatA of RatAB toxin-antitoxin module